MRKPKSRREPNRFVPQLRQLENRITPAGNVQAFVMGGTLVVMGDAAANQIFVAQPGKYTASITTLGDTTVNGVSGNQTFEDVYNGYIINLGGGDDYLAVIGNAGGGSLWIDLGEGNNSLLMGMVEPGGAAMINSGSGADNIQILGSRFENGILINTGAGNDRMDMQFSHFEGPIVVDGGAGSDLLSYGNVTVGAMPTILGLEGSTNGSTGGAPVANNDTASVAQGGSVTVNVAANDSGGIDPASVTIVSAPARGTAVANGNGTVTYTNTGGGTSDSFTYTVRNSAGAVSNVATVSINITSAASFATGISTTTPDPTKSNPFQVNVSFGADVTTLTAAAINVTNGSVGTITKLDARNFIVNIIPADQGTVSVSVTAGAVQGTGGGTNLASTTLTREFDSIAPVLTINSQIFSGFTPTITGTIDDPNSTVTVTVNGQTFNATVNGTTWSGTVPNDLPNGTYTIVATGTDAAGNLGTVTLTDGLVVDRIPPGPPSIALDPASDSGVAGDGITNDTTPTFTGTAEDGSTVEVFANDGSGSVSLGTTVATGGNWSLTVTTPLAAGNYAVTAVAKDVAGNIGPSSVVFNLTINTTAVTTTVTTSSTSPTNTSPISFTVTFSEDVTGFAEDDIDIHGGNGQVTNFVMQDARTYTFDVTPTAEGPVEVHIHAGAAQSTVVGTDSEESNTVVVIYDTVAPIIVINPLATNNTTPTITGTVDDEGTTISVTVNNQTFNAIVNGTTWSATVPVALLEGTYDIVVNATDAAGNSGTTTLTGGLVIDLTAPAAPTAALDPASDSGVAGDGLTNDTTPTFTGTAEDGATVEVFADSGSGAVSLGTTVAAGGTWTFTPTTALADGTYTVTAVATDPAGNDSPSSAAVNVTINSVAPTATLATTATSPTNTAPFSYTVTFSEDVAGFSDAGINVQNGQVSNFVMQDAHTYTFDVQPDGQGPVVVFVNAGAAQSTIIGTDNAESNTVSVVYDTVAPIVVINGLSTNNTTPTITGTVDSPGTTISVTVNSQTFNATVNGTTWSATVPAALLEGTYDISVDATDEAGNSGTTTLTNGLVIDLTAPATPTIELDPASDSGTPGDGLTNDPTPTFNGTAEDGATVEVFADGGSGPVSLGTTVAAGGNWTFTPTAPLANGTYAFTAVATDQAGNASPSSTAVNLTINAVIPTATLSTNATSPTNAVPISFTVTFSDDVTGFTAAGISVQNGQASNVVMQDAHTYTFDVTATGQGQVTVTINAGAAQSTASGNDNLVSNAVNVDFDSAAPVVGINNFATSNTTPTITGTVDDPTAVVVVTVNGQTFNATVNGTEWSATVPTALPQGTFDVSVTATDAAGNVGTGQSSGALIVDTTLPTITVDAASVASITGTASDSLSGVNQVMISIFDGEHYWNGTEFDHNHTEMFFPATSNDGFATWTFAFPQPGTYTVTARSIDVAGNASALVTMTVVVS